MSCATETTLTVFVMYLPPLTWEIYLLVNFFEVICYLYSSEVGIKRRTRRFVRHKSDNTYFLLYVIISLKPKACSGHNSHSV